MSEKALQVDLKPDACFGSKINFVIKTSEDCVGWLHFGKYMQGCIAEIVRESFKAKEKGKDIPD